MKQSHNEDVIPAKAGIHGAPNTVMGDMDSRFAAQDVRIPREHRDARSGCENDALAAGCYRGVNNVSSSPRIAFGV